VHKFFERILKLPLDQSFFLLGPRQVGKSTLIKKTFLEDSTIFIDLLIAADYRRYLKKPDLLKEEVLARQKKYTHIVIDEIQRVPELLNLVHYLIENDPSKPKFILSGSSARKLKRGQANLLAGRALTYFLYPLSYLELKEDFNLDKALDFGTLPSVYCEENLEIAKQRLEAYSRTYLQEEIKAEVLVRNLSAFMSFIDFVAEENGNEINFSNIASDIGVSANTVKEYFFILEDTLIGFFLQAYNKSIRKRLSKRPKFYLFDTGVQRTLANRLSLSSAQGTGSYGKSFEHFIIRELHTLINTLNYDFKLYYYRTSNGQEIDLILESPSRGLYAVEIKAKDANLKGSDFKALKAFKEENPNAKLICCSLSPRRRELDGILVLPWQEVFQELALV
jgi:predicted AAA+ superfamily ATPase